MSTSGERQEIDRRIAELETAWRDYCASPMKRLFDEELGERIRACRSNAMLGGLSAGQRSEAAGRHQGLVEALLAPLDAYQRSANRLDAESRVEATREAKRIRDEKKEDEPVEPAEDTHRKVDRSGASRRSRRGPY